MARSAPRQPSQQREGRVRIVLIGGGGHCRSCIDAIHSAGKEIAGVVDPDPAASPAGLPRLGDDSWLDSPDALNFCFLITVGQIGISPVRRDLFESLRSKKCRMATVSSRSAVVSDEATLEPGTIVLHGAIVNTGAAVGSNCIVNTGAIVEHDARIGDHCHISTGAIINGGAEIGPGCMIGSGASILQGVKIAADVMVGAGAVVIRDISDAGTWIGVPARRFA